MKTTLKFVQKCQKPWIVQTNPTKKNNAGVITTPRYHVMGESHSNKNGLILVKQNKTKQVDQWERRPRLKLRQLQSSDFYKGTNNTQQRNKSIFNKQCWVNWMCTYTKTGPLSLELKQLKIHQRPQHKTWNSAWWKRR